MTEMPELIRDLITFIYKMPAHPDIWKRFRIAMTIEEKEAYKAYLKDRGLDRDFVQAIRGIPIEIDPFPTKPIYFLEEF